jgi:hypothetical protein
MRQFRVLRFRLFLNSIVSKHFVRQTTQQGGGSSVKFQFLDFLFTHVLVVSSVKPIFTTHFLFFFLYFFFFYRRISYLVYRICLSLATSPLTIYYYCVMSYNENGDRSIKSNIKDYIKTNFLLLWPAIYPDDRIEENVQDAFWEQDDTLTHEDILLMIRECRSELEEAQTDWPTVTDCDLLDRVTADLEEQQILFVQHIDTTPSSCWSEIDNVLAKMPDNRGKKYIGAAYYHFQSTERAIAFNKMHIYFGSIGRGAYFMHKHTICLTSGVGSISNRIAVSETESCSCLDGKWSSSSRIFIRAGFQEIGQRRVCYMRTEEKQRW